jgi:WD40 repeat protein
MIDGEFVARSWDIDSGREISAIHITLNSLSHAVLDAQGAHLTLAGFANELYVYDVASGLSVSGVMQHNYQVKRLVTNANGTHTFSYGWDDTVNCWDAATGQRRMGAIWLGGVRNQLDLSPSQDGSAVLTHGWEASTAAESIKVWRGTRTGQPLRHAVPGQRNLDPCRLSPDGRLGCLGLDPSNRCYIYELATGRVVLDKQANGDVYVCLFSPDMRLCYVLTANGWLHGWSLETGEELWPPNQQSGKIRPAFITPDGTRIVVGHNDGHIRIYDTATGIVEGVLQHAGEIKTLRWAPDNSGRFLSASTNKIAHTWDIHTGQKLQTFTGHQHTIIASAWSPDSLLIATASYDSTVRVWSAATGQPIGTPMEHLAWLSHVEFSPDGKRVATACRDGTVRLWHPFTGQPASQVMQQGTTCETVRFTADGASILVRDHGGFRFWDAENGEPVTIHYPEPVAGGLGMDSESYRAIMNADGTRVFLGASMNDGAYWSVDQPRGTAPAWFADFIDSLAAMRQAGPGHTSRIPAGQLLKLRKQIESARDNGIHGQWATRIIGM